MLLASSLRLACVKVLSAARDSHKDIASERKLDRLVRRRRIPFYSTDGLSDHRVQSVEYPNTNLDDVQDYRLVTCALLWRNHRDDSQPSLPSFQHPFHHIFHQLVYPMREPQLAFQIDI